MEEIEFNFGSNWTLLPEGVKEFAEGVQERNKWNVKVWFGLDYALVNFRCRKSDKGPVMAAAQAALDKIVHREVANGWSSGNKITNNRKHYQSSQKCKEAALLVFSPPEILRASFRAVWFLPEGLAGEIRLGYLVPDEAAAKLGQLTSCILRANPDGRAFLIGANSPKDAEKAKHKLDALAEHAAHSPQPDLCRASFIYAEEEQDMKATLQYLKHGPQSHLKIIFLDRTEHDLAPGRSAYAHIFGKGVVVRLWDSDAGKLLDYPKEMVPVITSERKDEPFRAFQATWTYNKKEFLHDLDLDVQSPVGSSQDSMLESWMTDLPKLDQMLPHGIKGPEESQQHEAQDQTHPDVQPSLVMGSYDPSQPRRLVPAPIHENDSQNPRVYPEGMLLSHRSTMNQQARKKKKKTIANSVSNSSNNNSNNNTGGNVSRNSNLRNNAAHQARLPIAAATTRPVSKPAMDPVLVYRISHKLMKMLAGLSMFTGDLTLKVNFGRIFLTRIDDDLAWRQGQKPRVPVMSIEQLKDNLDKYHAGQGETSFTKILTQKGADANFISMMENESGRIWQGSQRRTVYEIICRKTAKDGTWFLFVIEVDGNDFSHRLRCYSYQECSLFVHCPKRTWDFEVALSISPDLDELYGAFAKDLVDHMCVVPQSSGVPKLELNVKKAYEVETMVARTVNVASYERRQAPSGARPNPNPDPSLLEIREVRDMTPLKVTATKNRVKITIAQNSGAEQLGQLPMWYEVSMQSKIINKALEQNKELEIGEKVDWIPEQLLDALAFDGLVRSAAEMVKKIDGVGYYGDNKQEIVADVPQEGPDGPEGSLW
ncbi:hypothetical protein GGR52DRAFT_458011 [Hypoxylon sp. FL1284]|nr:hypothetical protein GGR52DRAFT_458011 [Hypoxylon sp. FL1284]